MQKVMTVFLILLAIAILLFAGFLFSQNYFQKQSFKTAKVCIGSNCFNVELAENYWQQSRGLMYKESLAQNAGMLFIFNKEANYPFWMKNTKIPLDIIWINANKQIVYISELTQPCLPAGRQVMLFICPQINPKVNAKYVLEINGGLAQKFNFKIGDLVEIKK